MILTKPALCGLRIFSSAAGLSEQQSAKKNEENPNDQHSAAACLTLNFVHALKQPAQPRKETNRLPVTLARGTASSE